MKSPPTRTDWLVTAAVFGSLLLYCVVGAVRGKLYIPHHHSYGRDVFLSGFAAWAVVSALGSLWLGIIVRDGFFPNLSPKLRGALVFALFICGVALLLASSRLPSVTAA